MVYDVKTLHADVISLGPFEHQQWNFTPRQRRLSIVFLVRRRRGSGSGRHVIYIISAVHNQRPQLKRWKSFWVFYVNSLTIASRVTRISALIREGNKIKSDVWFGSNTKIAFPFCNGNTITKGTCKL